MGERVRNGPGRRGRASPLLLLLLAVTVLPGAGAGDGELSSGNLDPSDSWSTEFSDVGVYSYFCLPHPSLMLAEVEVVEAGTDGALRGDVAVTIRDYEFDPPRVVVVPGTTIEWTNDGVEAHTVELSAVDQPAIKEAPAWVSVLVWVLILVIIGAAGVGTWLMFRPLPYTGAAAYDESA